MSTPRRHLSGGGARTMPGGDTLPPRTPPTGDTAYPPIVVPTWSGYPPIPVVGETTTVQRRELSVSDTAEGYCIPILFGRFRQVCRVLHVDVVNQATLEIVVLVGHGELAEISKVEVDDVEVYPATSGWCEVETKLGTTSQTVLSNITHASWDSALPGLAIVGLRINLLAAPTFGGLPRVRVTGRGLKLVDPNGGSDAWNENPVWHAYNAMINHDWGAGIPVADVVGNTCDSNCDAYISYESLEYIGQTGEDSSVGGGDYDRLQSFVMPYANVRISVKMVYGAAGSYYFPCELRATKDGPAISGGPALVLADIPAGTYTITQYFGEGNGGAALVPGDTYYLVLPATETDYQWRLNSTTDAYADGHAQKKDGTWQDEDHDHWFKVAFYERRYRCSAIIDRRQPWRNAIQEILRTFHGRVGWWDSQYHITADWAGSSVGILSDKDNADIPMLAGTFRASRADEEAPNVCIVTYLDTETWSEKEVRYEATGLSRGDEQARELRVRALCVPSGGQAYRLAKTWLTRARRTWRGNCSIPQEGLDAELCDRATLDTVLYAATRTVLLNSIIDTPDGRFNLELLEYVAGDFSDDPYIPEAPVATTPSSTAGRVLFDDDFLSGGITDGTIGGLGWARTDWGGTVVDPAYSQETNHPGVLAINGGFAGLTHSSTTISLSATQATFAKNSLWYARFIFRVDNYDANGLCTVKASDIHCRVTGGNVDISTNGGSSWTTLHAVTISDWITFEASCDGAGTATYIVKVGTATYTGTAAISGSTVNQTISATAYGEDYMPDATLYLDRATLALGADR